MAFLEQKKFIFLFVIVLYFLKTFLSIHCLVFENLIQFLPNFLYFAK